VSTVLGLFYLSQKLWVSGVFALANALMLLYGIKHFIGFAELKQDLVFSAKEAMGGQAFGRTKAQFRRWVTTLSNFLRPATLPILRVRSSPRHAAWTILIAMEVLTPALATGAEPWLNPIQLENQQPGTTSWILTRPALHGEIEAMRHSPPSIAVGAMSDQNQLLEGRESLEGMEIAITVDDLPAHGEIPADMNRRDIGKGVLRALESIRTPPVYGFSNAEQLTWAPESFEVLKDWLQSGHLLGNHTFSHVNLARSTADDFIADIIAMDRLLTFLSPMGSPHKVFRYPYLNEGDTLEKHDRVRNFLENNAYHVAQITIHYDDWAWNNAYVRCHALKDKAKMQWLQQHVVAAARTEVRQAQKAAELVAGRDVRHILLVHLTAFNALTLTEVLSALQADGVRFIDLSRAMNDPIYRLNAGPSLSAGPTFLKQLIDTKNLPYPTGPKYPLEQIETMCKP
jgi:peptidoglycan/xylan/chitin deacetylase (PgdA/CDA1 family)